MRRAHAFWCFAVLFAMHTRISWAQDEQGKAALSVLPGQSRVISHSLSASRDTALLAYQVLPQVALTTGGDFALLGLQVQGLDIRAGIFGMVEVQTAEPEPLNFLSVPRGPYLWRGLLGYSLAVSFSECARQWLGQRGGLEAAISFRHESEHYTGSEPMFPEVPNIGDFFMPDVAARKALGPVDVDLRVQIKLFLPDQAYAVGPGADLIFRWRALDWLHPLLSFFGEYLFGKTMQRGDEEQDVPDNYLLRCLIGVVFPGKTADLQLVATASAGHGKGLLAFEDELRFGWAMRVGFFK